MHESLVEMVHPKKKLNGLNLLSLESTFVPCFASVLIIINKKLYHVLIDLVSIFTCVHMDVTSHWPGYHSIVYRSFLLLEPGVTTPVSCACNRSNMGAFYTWVTTLSQSALFFDNGRLGC